MTVVKANGQLLSAHDPFPVEAQNRSSSVPIVLTCEHGGTSIPAAFKALGQNFGGLRGHHHEGAKVRRLARQTAANLSAPLVIQRYSRFVVDCCYDPDTPDFVPQHCGCNTPLAANVTCSPSEKDRRRREIFDPFSAAIQDCLNIFPRQILFSLQLPPVHLSASDIRWDASFISHASDGQTQALMSHLLANDPGLVLEQHDYTAVGAIGQRMRTYKCAELCCIQMQISPATLASAEACSRWAELLATALKQLVS